jgi:hypothetical protein
MKIQLELNEKLIAQILDGIMSNFPEASRGNALFCTGWNYGKMQFSFMDAEDNGKNYELDKAKLKAALPLLFSDKWPKGCTPPPFSNDWERWENWLCQADATDFDAFAQLACLGEVIYG